MKNSFIPLVSLYLLPAIFIFNTTEIMGITKPVSSQQRFIQRKTTLTIPANISVWMDSELSKAKRKQLLTNSQFFTRDSAKVVGYIKGYKTNLGFKTVKVVVTNDLTKESMPLISEIDSMGKFICSIPMIHPRKVAIAFDKQWLTLYLEPGQVLALSFDWNDFIKTDGFNNVKDPGSLLLFRGPLAKLNFDFLSFLGYRHNKINKAYLPEQYVAAMDSLLTQNDLIEKQALKDGQISPKVIKIQKNEASLIIGLNLLDYAITKNYEGVQIPTSYYNILRKLPLNDPSSIVSEWYGTFINRFEFNPILMKGYQNIKKFKIKSEMYQNIWSNKDSLLKNDLHLPSSFTYEATKIRSFSKEVEEMGKNEAYAYFAKLSEGIKNLFLQQEGLRILKSRFGKENVRVSDRGISTPRIAEKPQAKWMPLSLPQGKDADTFNKLIAPYKGKYLFVDFWGTNCGPCRWEIEHLKPIRDKYKDNGLFAFVFITCNTWSPDKDTYEKYIKEQALKHSVFVSVDDFNYMQQLFHFTAVPHGIFIDPTGKILDVDFETLLRFDEALKWIQSHQL